MLITLLSFKLWLTPVVTNKAVVGAKLTAHVVETSSLDFYAKVRVYDPGFDLNSMGRTGKNPTITARLEIDFQ